MPSLIHECHSGIPELVEDVARKEGISPRVAARSIARGRMVVPANPVRRHRTCGIGEGCRVKVNVNVGTSGSLCDPALEETKARAALENGADTLMDLSTGGDLRAMRRTLLSLDVPVGTVPVYEAVRRAGSAADLDADLLFSVIREHCRDGVDFLTLHCGVNRDVLSALRTDPRIMPVVSRGGAFHVAMMVQRDEENPLYSEFDYLLEILSEYGVVASLGDGMRPGCLQDAERHAKAVEYLTLGRLAGRALEAGVQRMIEGPGHVPLPQVPCNVQTIKELSNDAPLYLLGPIVTDIAPGYDHVVSAIGGQSPRWKGPTSSAWSPQASTSLCPVSTTSWKGRGLPGSRPISGTSPGTERVSRHRGNSRWRSRGRISTGSPCSPSPCSVITPGRCMSVMGT